jgi:hypothetical protein
MELVQGANGKGGRNKPSFAAIIAPCTIPQKKKFIKRKENTQ